MSESLERPNLTPYRQELIDQWQQHLTHVQGQLTVYDRLVNAGIDLPEEIHGDIEALLLLEEFYKRTLGATDE